MIAASIFMRRKTLAEELGMQALSPGSICLWRVGFGVPPKQSFKFAIAKTRSPTRETRVLPGFPRRCRFMSLVLGAWDLML
jgi:hypothetical protein